MELSATKAHLGLDMGEVVRETEMTPVERQMNLFAAPEQLEKLLGEDLPTPRDEDQADEDDASPSVN
ncbi:MAG: hypothetical protein P4L40_21600 [Terracidiphilus sp.]|nr:hypothetical protein [Terracidiphilus sp.]